MLQERTPRIAHKILENYFYWNKLVFLKLKDF